jgi:hypothetical protein
VSKKSGRTRPVVPARKLAQAAASLLSSLRGSWKCPGLLRHGVHQIAPSHLPRGSVADSHDIFLAGAGFLSPVMGLWCLAVRRPAGAALSCVRGCWLRGCVAFGRCRCAWPSKTPPFRVRNLAAPHGSVAVNAIVYEDTVRSSWRPDNRVNIPDKSGCVIHSGRRMSRVAGVAYRGRCVRTRLLGDREVRRSFPGALLVWVQPAGWVSASGVADLFTRDTPGCLRIPRPLARGWWSPCY